MAEGSRPLRGDGQQTARSKASASGCGDLTSSPVWGLRANEG